MKRKTISFVLWLTLIVLLSAGCKSFRDKPGLTTPAFHPDVSAFTAGIVSSRAAITIELAHDYEGEFEVMAPVKSRLFEFTPKVKGTAYWLNARTLEFRPEEPLPNGQLYEARFHIGKVIDVPKDLARFDFSFQVISQAFAVELDGMEVEDHDDGVRNSFRGVLHTSDYMEEDDADRLLKAYQEGRSLPIRWVQNPGATRHSFIIDSLLRGQERTFLRITWDGRPLGMKIHDEYTTEIPAQGEFAVMDVRVIQHPEQHVQVWLSDPLSADQQLDGMVVFPEVQAVRYRTEGNRLFVYPVSRLTGTYTMNLHRGLLSSRGVRLAADASYEVLFEDVKPAVRLSGRGVILPDSDGLIFPFEAVNLRAVDLRVIKIFENNVGQFLQVNAIDGDNELKRAGRLIMQRTIPLTSERPLDFGKWNSFSFDLSDLLKTEPGVIYRIEIGFRKEHSLYPCGGDVADEEGIISMSDLYREDDVSMIYWDNPDMYWDPSATYSWEAAWFDWEQRDNPCHDSYYGRQRSVGRNVLASNLGIIAKGGNDNKLFFAISDLRTTVPLADVKLDVYNYQNQLVGSVSTDQDGMAVLSADMKPYLLVASLDQQRGYLRLDDGSALSLSRFDVSGELVQRGMKGFIYADRGVWRPGDSLHVTFMLEDKQRQLPANHPVSFEFYNPAGQLVSRQSTGTGVNGFYYFGTATSPDAPTGNWRGLVRVGGATFTRIFKIETVRPNRLKISLDFGAEMLGVHRPDVLGQLRVNWLHGAPARNLRAEVSVMMSQVSTSFTSFPDFIFDDPSKSFVAEETTIFDAQVDAQGYAAITHRLSAGGAAPGMLQAHLTTRVFEESGEYSIDRITRPFSPYKTYVGIRVPPGDRHAGLLSNNQRYQVDVVTVDHTGRLLPAQHLDVHVYKLEWRWWWDTAGESLASYMGSTYPRPVFSERINATNGRGSFQFRVDQPDWGRFLIRVSDPEGGHSTGQVVFIDWPGEAARSEGADPEAAAMLSIFTDKEKYEVGDMVHVSLPVVRQGRALVSLETGSRVIQSWWEEAREGELKFSFPADASMSPNIFLHVSLIQPHAQTINDLPIRMYGVVPLLVEDPATRLSPVLEMPASLTPEQEVSIRVKEANGKRMTYTLAVVDEGLLDLTRFRTPNPWDIFYAKEALGIHTWDIYDHVLGAFGGRIEQVFSIGGDEAIVGTPRPQANRFKPVVRFFGPFTVERNRTNNHRFYMPPYVGSVRVMLVAGDQGAYGHVEKTVAVKKPLMVLSTLPRIISPGERITMPVTVFAMDEELKNVNVSVTANDLFLIPGTRNAQIDFDQPGDQVINFELEVKNETGIGVVRVEVSSGTERASHEIEIDIRNPNPLIHDVTAGLAESGQEVALDYDPVGMAGTNAVVLELSSLPPVDFGRRLRYLVSYPHGCLEQVASAAFPQLYLGDIMDTDVNTTQLTETHIREAIRLIASYQRPDGGLRYWPGGSDVSDWGTSYAGHFMLEAAMKGYALPLRFRESWISYQSMQARTWAPASSSGRYAVVGQDHLLQAYRLFTLALAGSPELGAMNRLREAASLSLQARWRLAAAYILAGQPEAANQLIEGSAWEVPDYNAFNPSYGSGIRDMAMILETLILMNKRDEAFPVMQKISNALSADRWMNTQSTAYCLLAFAKYAGGIARAEGVQASVRINDDTELAVSSEKFVFQHDMQHFADSSARIRVLNKSQTPVFVRVMAEGVPGLEAVTAASNNLQTSVRFLNTNGQPMEVDRLMQGTDLMAEISVSNPGRLGTYTDMVLTQFFPAGWEIRNTRMDHTTQQAGSDIPAYLDIRDDRVHIHFDLHAGQTKKFVVLLHVAYLGRYYMPGTFGYAMYHDDVYARLPGKWVEVVMIR